MLVVSLVSVSSLQVIDKKNQHVFKDNNLKKAIHNFVPQEDESITLGRGTTEAAKMVGKNCLVMKVLSHKYMNIEALRKNMRMLWKTNKGVQINEIGEELFLAEFGDGRDKKRIMDMSPWTYEKQLILLKEFEGEQVPKDIQLWQSPFWVQIHNLPLHYRTRETS